MMPDELARETPGEWYLYDNGDGLCLVIDRKQGTRIIVTHTAQVHGQLGILCEYHNAQAQRIATLTEVHENDLRFVQDNFVGKDFHEAALARAEAAEAKLKALEAKAGLADEARRLVETLKGSTETLGPNAHMTAYFIIEMGKWTARYDNLQA